MLRGCVPNRSGTNDAKCSTRLSAWRCATKITRCWPLSWPSTVPIFGVEIFPIGEGTAVDWACFEGSVSAAAAPDSCCSHVLGRTSWNPRLTNVLVISVLAINLLLANLVGYYIWIAYSGDPGDTAVNILDLMLRHRQDMVALFGAITLAIPGLAMGLATKDNKITRNGGSIWACWRERRPYRACASCSGIPKASIWEAKARPAGSVPPRVTLRATAWR